MKKLLLLFGILLLFGGSAMAYKLPRWAINPIDIYLPDESGASVVRNAFTDWSAKSGGLFRYRFLNTRFASTNADIIVHLINEKSPTNLGSSSRRNETVGYFKNMPAGYIIKADLKLYTLDKDGKAVNNEKLYAAAMHEIGYIMGLEKVYESKDPKSIMNVQNAGIVSTPSEDDLKEIKEIYTRQSSDVKK